jgi:hypothetical protein
MKTETLTIWKNNKPLCVVESKDEPLWWQERGLSFTASGYGKRIPTRHMVRYQGRWRRVYICCFSNAGTAYIGKWVTGQGAELTISN